MGNPSSSVAGLTAAGFRFAFEIALSRAAGVRVRQRQAVVDYLDGWVPLRIVAEHDTGRHARLWIETHRRVPVEAASDFVTLCPGYVRNSFKMLS